MIFAAVLSRFVKIEIMTIIDTEIMMDLETRTEIEAVRGLAHDALHKVNAHELVCAERYKNLMTNLEKLDKTVEGVVSSTQSLPWKFVAGAVLVGGFLITMVAFALQIGGLK